MTQDNVIEKGKISTDNLLGKPYKCIIFNDEEHSMDEVVSQLRWAEQRERMRAAYDVARAAKRGSKIECPVCGKSLVKRSYQQVFCSNKGRGNCKDRYWNCVDENRSFRAQLFNKED